MKTFFIALLILVVIDSIYTVKYGYNKKPVFWKVFQSLSLFFVPVVLIVCGVNEAITGSIIGSALLIGFGILMGSILLIVGFKQPK